MHNFIGTHHAQKRQLVDDLTPPALRPVNPAQSRPTTTPTDDPLTPPQRSPNSPGSTPSDDPDVTVDTPIQRPAGTTPTSSSSSSTSRPTEPTTTSSSTQPPTRTTSTSTAPITQPTSSSTSTSTMPTTTMPTTVPTPTATSPTFSPSPTVFQTVTSTDGTGGVATVFSTVGGAQTTGALTSGSNNGSDVNIGAIIGGIAGGIAGLIILIYLILLPIRRRAQKQREIEWLAFESDHHNTDSSAAAVFGRGGGASSRGHGLKANSSIGGSIEAAAYGMSEVGHASPDVNRAESYGHGGQAGVGAGLYTHLDQGSASWQQPQQGVPSPSAGYGYNEQQEYDGYYGAAGQSTELGYYNAPSPEQHPQQFHGSPAQLHSQQQQPGYNYSVSANGAPQLAPSSSLSHSNSYQATSPAPGLARQPSEVMALHHNGHQWADTTATSPYSSQPQATRQRTITRSGSIDSRREAESARGGLHVVNDN